MKIKLFLINGFTHKNFSGNPAATCIIDEWYLDRLLQKIATELNQPVTTFLCKNL